MERIPRIALICLSAVLLIALPGVVGCGKEAGPAPEAMPVDQVPATLESAFSQAPADVSQQATEAVAALESNDDAAAFERLENLSGRNDLTPEQRQAAVDAWLAVQLHLQEQAAAGNQAAQQTLEQYRARK